MSFTQPDIKGYQQLSESEVALINEIKEEAVRIGHLVDKLRAFSDTCDQRWVSIGATDIQKGFMALVRSVAQPTTF